jgi:hypothetical protein
MKYRKAILPVLASKVRITGQQRFGHDANGFAHGSVTLVDRGIL